MRNIKILEMLNDNKIEELKTELRDEIYTDSLKEIPTAKKRYIAMKKYFSYTNETREILQKPCKVIVNGIDYTCFTNAKTLALTTENTGEIELLDKTKITYPDINKLITFAGIKRKINFSKKIRHCQVKRLYSIKARYYQFETFLFTGIRWIVL